MARRYIKLFQEHFPENQIPEDLELELDSDSGEESHIAVDSFINQIAKEAEEIISGSSDMLKKEEKRNEILFRFINSLPYEDVLEFLEDIFLENDMHISKLFYSTRWATVSEMAFDWLLDLPYQTLKKVQDALDNIFEKALHENYENSTIVIEKIVGLSIITKIGLSAPYIKSLIQSDIFENNKYLKLDLMIMLAEIEEYPDAHYWEKVDIRQNPYLAPAILTAFRDQNQIKGLLVLKKLDEINYLPNETELDYFRNHLKWTMKAYLSSKEESRLINFEKLKESLQTNWILELIDEILVIEKLQIKGSLIPHVKAGAIIRKVDDIENSLKLGFKDFVYSQDVAGIKLDLFNHKTNRTSFVKESFPQWFKEEVESNLEIE